MRLTLFFLYLHLVITNISSAQLPIMYPGDANDDGAANHFDLLPIGIAYGLPGPPRIPASLDWVAQPGVFWDPPALPVSQIPLTFVDCNGDGLINSLDVAAIVVNYDSTQNNSDPPPIPYTERLTQFCFSCPPPEIVVTFNQDTVSGFDEFSATFSLRYPPGIPPQLGALGIAFDVKYDYDPDKIIDSLTEASPDTIPADRMYVIATHTEVTSAGLLPPAGVIGFAAAGKGENIYFMSSPLFTVNFVISDMIVRDGEAPEFFTLNISNVLILNNQEQIIGLGGIQMDTVIVATKDLPGTQPFVQLSPNPVREILTVESPESLIEQIEIFNLQGEQVISQKGNRENRFELPVAALPPGMWLAAVKTRNGVAVKKFLKAE